MTANEDPLRINEQFIRAYGTDDEWLAYCDAYGVDPGPAFREPEIEPEPKTGLDRMRLAIRQARGEFAPTARAALRTCVPRGPLPKAVAAREDSREDGPDA